MGISITQPIRPASTRHSGVLFFLLAMFILLLVGPFLVGRFVYETKYNELKAGYDVATGTLQHVKPRLNDLELASRLVAKRVEPSVVSIIRPSGRFAGHDFEGQGSGVIVDKAGYIVTNFHVVEGAQTVQVRLSDRRTAEATVVGADAMTDIAVLKIDLDNLIAAEWGDSDKLEVGDLVWALGSPYGLDRSLTFGIVSAKSRRSGNAMSADSPYQEYLQTDAAVNPGQQRRAAREHRRPNRGHQRGDLRPAYQGISFSIPSALARERYDELRAKGHIDRAWLGIQPLDVPEDIRKKYGLEIGRRACSSARSSRTRRPVESAFSRAISFSSGTITWPPIRRCLAARSPRPKSVPPPSSFSSPRRQR